MRPASGWYVGEISPMFQGNAINPHEWALCIKSDYPPTLYTESFTFYTGAT